MNLLEIDGVPTLFARRDGATTVNLMFRVGLEDETLPERGITHMVEHLALFPLGLREHHSNGETGTTVTNVHATGDPGEVVSFLDGVTQALSAMPYDRLAAERLVLRTEASQRGGWFGSDLAIWRHGAVGPGVAGYHELGLDRIGPDDLEQWRQRYFTRGNAQLVVIGPAVPAGLSLALPDGPRRPLAPVEPLRPGRRSTFSVGTGGVLFDTYVPRSFAATIAAQLVARTMYQRLRLDSAYSYTATCRYDSRDATTATVTGFADALDEQTDVVVGSIVDILTELRVGAYGDDAIAQIVKGRLDDMGQVPVDERELTMLGSNAFDLLVGGEPMTFDAIHAELSELDVADVRRAMDEVFDDLVLQVPAGRSADWGGFDPLPEGSEQRVKAVATYRGLDGASALHRAVDGVMTVTGDIALSVFYEQCAACLAWPDGKRVLIGDDGIVLSIEPTMIEHGPDAVAAVDAALPPRVVVPQQPRDPADVPQPQEQQQTTQRRGWRRRRKD